MSEVVQTEFSTKSSSKYQKNYALDKEYGAESERLCLPILKEKFDPFLIKNENRYAIFDYVGSSHFIELKTRRYNSDKYPDSMIGVNKIKNAISQSGGMVL